MTGPLRVTIEFRQIAEAARGGREAALFSARVAGLEHAAAQTLLAALKAATPARTGALRASIVARAAGASGVGFYGLAYGKLLVQGTRPHVIVPRTKQALAWPGAGHPVRRVQHPGTRPDDFPRRAVDAATPVLRALLLADGRRVIRLIQGGTP